MWRSGFNHFNDEGVDRRSGHRRRPLIFTGATNRQRMIIRVDAGGGSVDEVNWLLGADYHLHCKDFSSARAKNLAATVKEWISDPHTAGRELGWMEEPGDEYIRGVRWLALRWKKKSG